MMVSMVFPLHVCMMIVLFRCCFLLFLVWFLFLDLPVGYLYLFKTYCRGNAVSELRLYLVEHDIQWLREFNGYSFSCYFRGELCLGQTQFHAQEIFELLLFVFDPAQGLYGILEFASCERMIKINEDTATTHLAYHCHLLINIELHAYVRIDFLFGEFCFRNHLNQMRIFSPKPIFWLNGNGEFLTNLFPLKRSIKTAEYVALTNTDNDTFLAQLFSAIEYFSIDFSGVAQLNKIALFDLGHVVCTLLFV